MSNKQHKDPFWTSYSDLMTSLFFVMLVLFVICLIHVGNKNKALSEALDTANATNEQLHQILKLESQFEALSKSTSLAYDEDRKMFYAKDLVGIEIFNPEDDVIKEEYLSVVDSVGADLNNILEQLNDNKQFHYQLVIEGNAAIHWKQLRNGAYDPDDMVMYLLSYRRALALYDRWKTVDGFDFRKYNTEVIIAGSGFNGNNRDTKVEENNKRFVIQIVPKVGKPQSNE